MRDPFIKPLAILHKLQQNGYLAYFVGGSVRDFIIGRPIGDIDIATSARPEDVVRLFPKVIEVGIEHGTVVVVLENEPYEVTTFRTESDYKDFRRPDEVTFISSLEGDLERRDFTMNAIAMDEDETLIDPFGGRNAIKRGIIETVGNADERFSEDALRMMRAVRFMSQLSFTITPEVKEAIRRNRHLLQNIAMERISVEFQKLMLGNKATEAFRTIVDTGLLDVLPLHEKKELIEYDWTTISEETSAWSLLCLILEVEDTALFLRKWKLSNKRIKETEKTVVFYRSIKEWTPFAIYQSGLEVALRVNHLKRILQGVQSEEEKIRLIYESLPIYSPKDIEANGKDLVSWGNRAQGPWIAQCIQELSENIVCGKIENDRNVIKEWVSKWSLKFDENC